MYIYCTCKASNRSESCFAILNRRNKSHIIYVDLPILYTHAYAINEILYQLNAYKYIITLLLLLYNV